MPVITERCNSKIYLQCDKCEKEIVLHENTWATFGKVYKFPFGWRFFNTNLCPNMYIFCPNCREVFDRYRQSVEQEDKGYDQIII